MIQTEGLRFLFKPYGDGSWYCQIIERSLNIYLEWKIDDGWIFDCSNRQGVDTELSLLIKSVWESSFGDRFYFETEIEQMKQDVETMFERINKMSSFL